jgi:ADP-ribose pyrophosphatase YjhB (NUDIX family)
MYKVFIQNRPIFFISEKEIKKHHGIFVHEKFAITDQVGLTDLLTSLPTSIFLNILCEKPQETMELFFENHQKVEAAGGIVKRKEKYLFIKRNGLWDIPKGKLENNETPETGALREVEEECGISNFNIDKHIITTYHTYEYKGVPTLKKTYWFSFKYEGPKKGTPQLEEGITKIAWKKKEEMNKILENTYASIADVIHAYFI